MTLRITPIESVGRYRLLGELGQGGTATVSLAVARGPAGFNKLVVLKKMKPQFISEPGFADMFMSEARLAARLNHPNIVQTNEVFEHEGLPVLVMEYLEGRSFADIGAARTPTGPFKLGHSLTVISEALSGLHYSHELTDYNGRSLELVHRDVTPHNVFVSYEGQVKILDFGIAKLKDSSVNTETGVVKGKLRYIPPEQIVGEAVDRRADIYAVGVMLWEIAAGEKLWRGLSDAAVMNRVINERIPRPSEKNPDVNRALEAVIMRALSADPEARHSSALHLQQEVDEVRAGLPNAGSARDLIPALDLLFGADRSRTRKLVEVRLAQLQYEGDEQYTSHTSPTLKAYSARKPQPLPTPGASRWPWFAPVLVALGLGWFWLRQEAQRDHADVEVQAASQRVLDEARMLDDAPSVRVSGAQPGLAAPSLQPVLTAEASLVRENSQATARGPGLVAPPAHAAPSAPGLNAPPSSAPLQRAKTRRAVSDVGSEPMPLPAAPNCEPPFVVDARGVKRFKRECVR